MSADEAASAIRPPTFARDVMTRTVVTVKPDTTIRAVALALYDHNISAVPVVTEDGTPIGMVSEGDLIGRPDRERVERREWWLALLAGRQTLDDPFQARLRPSGRTAADVMAAPLVTVTEDTGLDEVARLLIIFHIKRVPVLRDGRLVGIVSRADLVRVVGSGGLRGSAQEAARPRGFLYDLLSEFGHPASRPAVATTGVASAKAAETRLSADDFRHLVADFHNGETEHHEQARRAAAERRRERAKELIEHHMSDPVWRELLHHARVAAEHGEKEHLLLQFPSQLCLDSGRSINVAEARWPASLRGEPAEIYLRWERELRPHGFGLSARVLDFPDGKPGDVGLFLVWGE